jgi:hypothetical protein
VNLFFKLNIELAKLMQDKIYTTSISRLSGYLSSDYRTILSSIITKLSSLLTFP